MPTFNYAGDDSRYYPLIALEVNPGDSAEFPEMPTDGRWVEVPAPAVSPMPVEPAPVGDPAPTK